MFSFTGNIIPACIIWFEAREDHCPFQDPFWAFYWPGGQVLARFLLENRHYVEKKSVLDIGSGCGALAIISKMLGATRVVANDIDPVAITAIEMNSSLNDIVLETEHIIMIILHLKNSDKNPFSSVFLFLAVSLSLALSCTLSHNFSCIFLCSLSFSHDLSHASSLAHDLSCLLSLSLSLFER
ncbi:ETFBKMT [Acanthosepion pharaonis]|uniref:ETFB lysine methyltransferase n=1 Tax=Acanthosepion pharaonis TaxID=158019 RepID=A0A812BE88_ACAPH|nr:ETFBKMT [Sepia pharaonis]